MIFDDGTQGGKDAMESISRWLAALFTEGRPAPRRRVQVDLKLASLNEQVQISTRTFDVSETGAFVSLRELPNQIEKLNELGVGTACLVRLTFAPFRHIYCKAKVVRHAVARGEYPPGLGLRFQGLNKTQRKVLSARLLNGL